jgi:UDP-N-acetylmuramoyl-L-alanyl-D-glutamate--2,6-diaminopimelate ligase
MTHTMTLSQILSDVPEAACATPDVAVSGVAYDSRRVAPGDVFFCVTGFAHDGHDHAADAVERGAVALVVGHPVLDVSGVPQVIVPDVRLALALAAARAAGMPSRRLALIGITGTNGKTTTTYLMDSVLREAGHVTGLIGTVETRIGETRESAGRTTPESADLQRLLARMVDAGVTAATMEVSSHALDLHRVAGTEFAVAAFTNLSQDHLDYHKTLEEYFSVKRRLFTDVPVGTRVVDVDDPHGRRLAAETGAEITVGMALDADVRAEDVVLGPEGSSFLLVTPVASAQAHVPIPGAFNVANALVAAGCAHALDIDAVTIARGLRHAPQVPGRLERIANECGITALVDYAHTPDGLDKALRAVRSATDGALITVFGCGGDRDPDKRPRMGEVAGSLSDKAIVTSDNPRTEDPVGIILQIEDGLRSAGADYEVEVDRRRAIGMALGLAKPGDAVLIAGKGHEDYQIFADRTIHFDDREIAREELRQLC